MALRCFLFCSDEGTSDIIRQVLTGLDVEGETCPTPTIAVEKVTHEAFHLVIIDWDQQPEASMLLGAAHDRKAAERPLTLAIVSDDISVPKALQAGANSILRKPLLLNQVTDTLTTARDLLRSRIESASKPTLAAAVAASVGPPPTLPASLNPTQEKTLRAGEFLQSAPSNPGGQFVIESETVLSSDQSLPEPIDALKDLESVAAPAPPPLSPPVPDEPRGLEWYLKKKGIQSGAAAAPAPALAPPPSGRPELLGYDQTPSYPATQQSTEESWSQSPAQTDQPSSPREQKKEAALFAHIAGESGESEETAPSRFRIGKSAVIAALALAACAIIAAPQAPWHAQIKTLWGRGQRSLHAWLNPQPVTAVAQAPAAHEDFSRAGDEYKLPVAENIPDASTDPSQIQVLPEVDPTAKKPAGDGTSSDQPQTPTDATTAAAPAATSPAIQVQNKPQENPTAQPTQPVTSPSTPPAAAPTNSLPAVSTIAPAPNPAQPTVTQPAVAQPPTPVAAPAASVTPPPRRQPTPYVPPTTKVPSSLQSQIAVMMPDASGNKPADAAMPAIEPVTVPELAERNLLTDQPPMDYPATATGQQGTVILQVLIGRDGLVQDAKFLQGSLAFARTAIDGVRQWKFKPYTMNGRPVSVQTTLTVKFKPIQ